MGAYLSEPVVEKQTESANGDGGIHYGASSMQGWRINQEDAHNCLLNFDDNCAFFAVYDGHGGADVSQYASMRFPEFLKSMSAWNEGRFGQALEDAFLKFDELLTRDDVMEELKVLAGSKKGENECDGEPEEDKAILYEEACLPLQEVLRRYGITVNQSLLSGGVGGEKRFISPKIKIKREKRVPVNASTVGGTEDGNGPPTPPSSPDARSAAAAAAAISTTTPTKCDSSAAAVRQQKQQRQENNAETLPMSPPQLLEGQENNNSASTKRIRYAVKRKSHHPDGTLNDVVDDEENSTETGDRNQTHESDGKIDQIQTNGIGSGGGVGIGGDGKLKSPDVLPQIKRFKDDGGDATMESNKQHEKMVADSTTILDESNDSTPPSIVDDGGEKALNGSSHAASNNDGKIVVDSTSSSDDQQKLKIIKKGNLSILDHSNTADGVGSPMMVEEPNLINKTNDEKSAGNNRSAADHKGLPMDESSGASEDDEDEDYNMEVEDEETSDDSSESDGIEEDEIVDEQDEMGVDEEEEDEEEDDEMFAMPSGDTPGVDSGTTACVALIRGSTIYVANAGDSRCVLCRGDTAVDLSLDHKPEDTTEKRRIELAGGRITTDGRVNGGLNLSRAIGDHFYKRNTELPLREQMITALPDVRVEPLKPEDRFLILACDGIWNSMNSQDVVDFVRARLAKGMTPANICEQLCDVCLAPNTIGDGTGCDNMTTIIVLLNQNLTEHPNLKNSSSSVFVESSNNDVEHAALTTDQSEAEARCT